jgi:PTS system nitrogen regulatory IIA component
VPANLLGHYFSAGCVALEVDAADKFKALSKVALLVGRCHQIDAEVVERALLRREQTGSTALGYGIAIPHARIGGISNPILAFVRLSKPLKFGAPDHKPVGNLFAILVSHYATEEHLRILATVSSMFANESFRAQLNAAASPEEVHRLFTEWPVN